MAKIYGLQGTLTGKIGATVFAVRNGEQIARQYQPVVSNPSSDAQVAARAKLKLISQLSAVLGPVIAIRRVGSKSPRNLFVKSNYPLVSYSEDMAEVNLNRVQLTQSVVGLIPFTVDRSSGTEMSVALDNDARGEINRVVYVAVTKGSDNKLRLHDSVVASEAGENGTFPAQLDMTTSAVVVYAYGIRDNSTNAISTFGNMTALAAEDVAKLIVSRRLTDYDVTLTETLGATMAVGENSAESESFEKATVTISSVGGGVVTGGGRFPIGTILTVHAVPNAGGTFIGWHLNSESGSVVSTSADYTFKLESDITLVAEFHGAPVHLVVSSEDTTRGTVRGSATVDAGTEVTATAVPTTGYRFAGWFENDTMVSAANPYTFTIQSDRALVAHFDEANEMYLDIRGGISSVKINGNTYTSSEAIQVTPGTTASFEVMISQGYSTPNTRFFDLAHTRIGETIKQSTFETLIPANAVSITVSAEL